MCLSEEHGKRIIEYLEGIGGSNNNNVRGTARGCLYGIDNNGNINCWGTYYVQVNPNFEIIELPEEKPMSELEQLKQQALALEESFRKVKDAQDKVFSILSDKIAELERQPETFEAILEMLDDDVDGLDYESMEELEKISKHSYLYYNLKRIEAYVNKKFGGGIDWNDEKTKYGVFYDHRTGKIDFEDCCYVASSPFAFISEEAYEYFVKVTGEHLVNFFKTTH